jgi:hypothetical protein
MTEPGPETGKYVRKCMVCGEVMDQPLEVEGRIYKFCCMEHKRRWDAGHKAMQKLAEREELEEF